MSSSAIQIVMLSLGLACTQCATAGKIVYPWRSSTAIVLPGNTFEIWFDANVGQTVQSVVLEAEYHSVNCTHTSTVGDWEYDQMSGNRYDTRITATVPAGTPEDRYDLVLKTSSGDEISYGGVKVVTAFRDDYYIVHISDAHFYQANHDTDVLLKRKTAMIDIANIIDAQLIIETGDNSYNVRNHPEREVILFQGDDALGIKGNADATAATFLVPGDHDAYLGNDWPQSTEQVNADFFNDYWGLQNHSFRYGKGRFMMLNNAWNVSTSSAKNHAYQINEAVAWLGGVGSNGNFFVTAGHVYDKLHEFIDDVEPLDLVLAGDKHHAWTDNPYAFDTGSAEVAYIAPAIRDYFRINLFRVNDAAGSFTPVPGALGEAPVLNSGNKNDPATWIYNMELNFAVANDGTSSENTATIVNRFAFPVEAAHVRFVMPKGISYEVSPGEVRQAFDGDGFHIVDVRVDLGANSSTAVNIFAGGSLSNSAEFVSQSVPSTMTPGQVAPVSVTMKNTGINTWSAAMGHGLGSVNSDNASLWTGSDRVPLPSNVASNDTVAFNFDITAPAEPGFYDFQWRMTDDIEPNKQWFGAVTPKVKVGVGLSPIHVEAENYATNVGFQFQSTSDVGGGQNTSHAAAGYYLTYDLNVGFAGVYQIISRNASLSQPTSFDVLLGNQVLCSVNQAATGGYQTWQSFTNELVLPAGAITLKVLSNGNGWNMNWFKLVPIDNPPPMTAPVVSFNQPSGDVTLNAGANLYVHVNATDPDGIERVWLYKDGVVLGRSEGQAAYGWGDVGQNDPELHNLQPGTFVLTAKALDNTGEEAWTVSGITVTVDGDPQETTNLVTNPSFDAGSSGWRFLSGATTEVASLRLGALGHQARQTISIIPGATYHFGFRVNTEGMTAQKFVADTNDIYDDTCQFVINNGTSGWGEYSGTFEATTDTIMLRFFTSGSFAGTVYVDDVVLTLVSMPSPYDLWATAHSVTGLPLEDDDGDGRVNFVEYALNGNPAGGGDDAVLPRLVRQDGNLLFIHSKRLGDPSLSYSLEYSTNLISGIWLDGGPAASYGAVMGDYEEVTNNIPLGHAWRFYRVRVEGP